MGARLRRRPVRQRPTVPHPGIYDVCTRRCLAAIADFSLSGKRVARELDRLIAVHGRPTGVGSDNGTELTSSAILTWTADSRVDCHYIGPGKPVQNAFIESFNGRLRDSSSTRRCHVAGQAHATLEEWRRDYNTVRPHSSIGWLRPDAYAERFSMQRSQAAALTTGSAPWPLAPIRPRSSTARLWFKLDKSWGQRHAFQSMGLGSLSAVGQCRVHIVCRSRRFNEDVLAQKLVTLPLAR